MKIHFTPSVEISSDFLKFLHLRNHCWKRRSYRRPITSTNICKPRERKGWGLLDVEIYTIKRYFWIQLETILLLEQGETRKHYSNDSTSREGGVIITCITLTLGTPSLSQKTNHSSFFPRSDSSDFPFSLVTKTLRNERHDDWNVTLERELIRTSEFYTDIKLPQVILDYKLFELI